MEVCVDSVESAINAERGGAIRVELCANLAEGGTTPSIGTLSIIKEKLRLPVLVMIRPRGGDFLYTENEFEVMKQDMLMLGDKADGFVFGMLNPDGSVDKRRCQELMAMARPKAVTFHRAFDMTRDWEQSLEDIIDLGFHRVLTSGQDSTVLEGLPVIKKMVEKAAGRIIILPGGGINKRNLERILTNANVEEFHCSARYSQPSYMQYRNLDSSMGSASSEYTIKRTDAGVVQQMADIAVRIWKQIASAGGAT